VADPRTPSKVTSDQALAVPCVRCAADPGSPCDLSYYPSWLGIAVKDAPKVHTRRYQLAADFADARVREAARAQPVNGPVSVPPAPAEEMEESRGC
jgi:hypothetical protein